MIKLDANKLLGFRLAAAGKTGTKTGVKPSTTMGAKIGGKIGNKPIGA